MLEGGQQEDKGSLLAWTRCLHWQRARWRTAYCRSVANGESLITYGCTLDTAGCSIHSSSLSAAPLVSKPGVECKPLICNFAQKYMTESIQLIVWAHYSCIGCNTQAAKQENWRQFDCNLQSVNLAAWLKRPWMGWTSIISTCKSPMGKSNRICSQKENWGGSC